MLSFSKNKLRVVAIAFALLAVLMVANYVLKMMGPQQEITVVTPQAAVTYSSSMMRRLPCGRTKKHAVEIESGLGIKTAQLVDRDGKTVLDEKKHAIDADQCDAIQNGKFVPELWKGCMCACACQQCSGDQQGH